MTDRIADIPVAGIHTEALPRDRTTQDAEAAAELQLSILAEGLRQPIEVFRCTGEDPPAAFGLISGLRRLTAFKALGRDTIPAFIRQPADLPAALAAMVSENEIRAQISPWEKAQLIQTCLASEIFPNPDTAIDALFPALSRQKRSRLRGHLMVVEHFEGALASPERLTVARLDRLAAALRAGWESLLRNALPHRHSAGPEAQWAALEPVIAEALTPAPGEASPGHRSAPRRMATIRNGLVVRRELARTGWILRFTGPEARSPGIIDDILDEMERIYGR